MADNFWGDLIRSLREEQGLTQRKLCDRVRVNRSTLRKIEAGKTSPDMAVMERILAYLGYELEALAQDGVKERLRRQAEIEKDPDRRSILAANRIALLGLRLTILR